MATPSWFTKITALLKGEKAEFDDLKADTEARWSGALDDAEANLEASPSERMAQLQAEIDANDEAFDAIRDTLDD